MANRTDLSSLIDAPGAKGPKPGSTKGGAKSGAGEPKVTTRTMVLAGLVGLLVIGAAYMYWPEGTPVQESPSVDPTQTAPDGTPATTTPALPPTPPPPPGGAEWSPS